MWRIKLTLIILLFFNKFISIVSQFPGTPFHEILLNADFIFSETHVLISPKGHSHEKSL
jgi:hypothetical protein